MRNAAIAMVLALLGGCGDDDCMPLKPIPIAWPLTGGLDTKKSPLSIQPGSHLILDNVDQERLNEWRRRYGFAQAAGDSLPDPNAYFAGNIGDRGIVAAGQSSLAWYSPSFGSSNWQSYSPGQGAMPPVNRERRSLFAMGTTDAAIARVGNIVVAAGGTFGSSANAGIFDLAGGTFQQLISHGSDVLRKRGAATASYAVMFEATSAGNLYAAIVNPATLTSSLVLVHSGGGHATSPWLDAYWYGGSTITVVWRTSTNAVRFIEFNPATAAATVDTTLATPLCTDALSLLPDADGSGVRFVASSGGVVTRVTRVSSAGAALTNDVADFVTATQVTGVAHSAGAGWTLLMQTAGGLEWNAKVAGVVGAASAFQVANATIDSMAWRDSTMDGWGVILGLHSTNTDDPQDSYVEMLMPLLGAGGGAAFLTSSPVTLAAGKAPQSGLYQVVNTAARKFTMGLPVQIIYEDNAGVIVRHYSLDLFEHTYVIDDDVGGYPLGKPVQFRDTTFFPGNQITYYDVGFPFRLGVAAPPLAPSVVSSVGAGALTPAAQYGYVVVLEAVNDAGEIWRSPPSAPVLITLGAADNTVAVTWTPWKDLNALVGASAQVRMVLYRTAANGSSYRRIYATMVNPGVASVSYNDLLADSAVVDGEVLYTQGELSTTISPPARSLFFFDDRLWAINAEYPTEAWYTKNLRPGRMPEFTGEMLVDLDDEFGDLTNGTNMVDKAVLFKRSAVYFSDGAGFTDSGSGQNYGFTRISGDVGAILGSPVVSTGRSVFFVSERGIYSVDQQGAFTFHDAIDQFLNQPLVQTKETVLDGCFLSASNEVVFVTTNYLLVNNLTFGHWKRYTGLAGMKRCLAVDGKLVLIKGDGTVWRQGDKTQLTDGGVDFVGKIRSPWMRPTQGAEGPGSGSTGVVGRQALRLYEGSVNYTRTSAGTPVEMVGRIYRDNDDANVETFYSGQVGGSVLSGTGVMKPQHQKCTAFSLELELPVGDVTVRVDGFSAIIGIRDGAFPAETGQRWRQ